MIESKPRWTGVGILVALSGLTAAAGAVLFAEILGVDGWGPLDGLLLLLFFVLYLWISLGFWTATFGFVCDLIQPKAPAVTAARHVPDGTEASLPKTAILMPIHNEDPHCVFANLRAIRASLHATGHSDAFHIYVLSDTRDPTIWAAEEWAWARMRSTSEGQNLFYRRRTDNVDRKSGNIREFCEQWGAQYRYMIVLDADSLMDGATLVEMVYRMEDDPEVGILQVPPVLINRDSVFGRMLQFASALYGRIFNAGFSLWARSAGNYWGHNSILRVEPFMQDCGLPHLPGKPPWGGEILSHDFVEAALMLRTGWKVVVASDLGGSYEECPSNLIDYAKRDERWSRGNLQHLPLTIAPGMHPASRFHLAVGILSYLASSLWALFMLLVLIQGVGWYRVARIAALETEVEAVPILLALAPLIGALILLLMVKFWSLLATVVRPSQAAQFGTRPRLAAGVLLETLISFLLAPILMAFHVTFVINTFLGRKVEWEAQQRSEQGLTLAETVRVHSPHTIAGLAVGLLATWGAAGLFWWISPILFGLIFSIPISLLLASAPLGRRLRGAGIFLIPEEIDPPPVLRLQHKFLAEETASSDSLHPFERLVADPVFLRLHLALLPKAPATIDPAFRPRLQQIALSGGVARITAEEQLLLMQDPAALHWLHREAWKDWPLELLRQVASAAPAAEPTSVPGSSSRRLTDSNRCFPT
jgi:membrane glycosyltransferase